MSEIIRNFEFDVNFGVDKFERTDGSSEVITIVENDNRTTKFKFNFVEKIPNGTNVLVKIKHNTGFVKEYILNVQNQTAELILTNSILVAGTLKMTISYIGSNNEILTATQYQNKILVKESLTGETVIPEEDENLLEALISQVNLLNQETKEATQDAEQATENANNAAQVSARTKTEIENTFEQIQKAYQQQIDTDASLELASARTNKEGITYSNLKERLDSIETTKGHIYGIRRKITNNSNSAWERLFDSIGKVANATKNGGTVQNDFDGLAPWSEINSCNYDTETGKVKAWYGDATFKFDGSNGDVYTYIPDTYIKIYQDNDYDYILISDVQRSGFKHYDSFFVGRYSASKVNGKLRTYSDLSPEPISLNDARTLAKALGSKVHVMDYRYFIITILYLVEYADYNSQKMLGQGLTNSQDVVSLMSETSTNRIVVSSDLKGLYVGRQVAIGSAWWNNSIADRRRITKIEDFSNGSVTGKAIYFDGDAVNIAVGSHMWGIAQFGGNCDKLGMKSGCVINDGYHDMTYRGIEGLIGNIFNWLDGILLQKDEVYICNDPSLYNSTDYSKYKKISYAVLHGEGAAKTLGYDPDEPLIRYPVEVGASNNTYLTDYYWNNSDTNIHAPRVGGDFSDGANAGLFCWHLGGSPANSGFTFGCRLLIENQ